MRSAVDPSDIESGDVIPNRSAKNLPVGERYWEYVLIHVGNFLVDYWWSKCIIKMISSVYTLKEDNKTKKSYGPPDVYLRTKIHKFQDIDANEDDPHCWYMPGDHYVKNVFPTLSRGWRIMDVHWMPTSSHPSHKYIALIWTLHPNLMEITWVTTQKWPGAFDDPFSWIEPTLKQGLPWCQDTYLYPVAVI